MSTPTARAERSGAADSSSDVSGLDFDETELKLALPGFGAAAASSSSSSRSPCSEPEIRKRAFDETLAVDLLGLGSNVRDKDNGSPDAKPAVSKARVVGWPPVRSYRKNVLNSCTYVKVAVDGAPYLRKIDLERYAGYHQLLAALQDMFSACIIIQNENRLLDPASATEFVPTYEDKDGDWMLIGDVPWKMFVASCKRVRLRRGTEAVNLAPSASQ